MGYWAQAVLWNRGGRIIEDDVTLMSPSCKAGDQRKEVLLKTNEAFAFQ